jgi:hypothetical protein
MSISTILARLKKLETEALERETQCPAAAFTIIRGRQHHEAEDRVAVLQEMAESGRPYIVGNPLLIYRLVAPNNEPLTTADRGPVYW